MRARRPSSPHTDLRPCVNPHAAGLDIGREEIWACVPEDRDAAAYEEACEGKNVIPVLGSGTVHQDDRRMFASR